MSKPHVVYATGYDILYL